MPATEIPSNRMIVRVPTMRMSFNSSVIRASTSYSQKSINTLDIKMRGVMNSQEPMNKVKSQLFLTLSISTTVSAKPTTYMATATALAKAKMRPMEPPNSGPRLLEMR